MTPTGPRPRSRRPDGTTCTWSPRRRRGRAWATTWPGSATPTWRTRPTAGPAAPGRGRVAVRDGDGEESVAAWRDSWGDGDKTAGREEAYRRRFLHPRSRPFRTGDGGGVLRAVGAGTAPQA